MIIQPQLATLCAFIMLAIAARGADTPVGLKGFANRTFDDAITGDGSGGWTDEGPENSLNEFPVGRVEFEGIPFEIPADAPAVLALRGKSWPEAPEEVTIPTPGVSGRAIFLLSAHAWEDGPIELARLIVRYENGREDSLPVINLTHTGPWWNPVSLPAGVVAWRGKNRHGVGVGVFLSGHEIADQPLSSITVRASPMSGQLLILGLTVSGRTTASLPKRPPWTSEERGSSEGFPLAAAVNPADVAAWEKTQGWRTPTAGRQLVMELDAALTAPTAEVAASLVKELASLGYTAARLAPLDPLLAWPDFSPVRNLLASLKAGGLAASVTLAGGRPYSDADGVAAVRDMDPRFSEVFFVDPRATEILQRDMEVFWSEPPIDHLDSSSILYDGGLLSYHVDDLTRPHRRMLMNRWATWLRAHHGGQEELEKAWGVEGQPSPLLPGDNLARSRVELVSLSNILAASPRFRKRIAEQVQFLDEVQREWFRARKDFADQTLPSTLWSTTAWISPSWLRDLQVGLSASLDVVEERVELLRPEVPPEDGKSLFLDLSPLSEEGIADFLTPYYRVSGKPFIVWDPTGMWPGDRDFLRSLRTMVVAALQGWNGILHRKLYSLEPQAAMEEVGSVPGPALQNPAFLAMLPLGRHIFLRGDLDPLPLMLRRPLLTPTDIVSKLPLVPSLSKPLGDSFPAWIPFVGGVEAGTDVVGWRAAELPQELLPGEPVTAAGGQVALNPDADRLVIRTPRTIAVAGEFDGQGVESDHGAISEAVGYGVVYMTTLDNLPLSESGAVLLGLVGRCNNTGARIERSTEPRGTYPAVWRMADAGRAPILMERVAATFTLSTEKADGWTITPLDARGRPVGPSASIASTDGKLSLPLDNRTHRAPLLLLRRENP